MTTDRLSVYRAAYAEGRRKAEDRGFAHRPAITEAFAAGYATAVVAERAISDDLLTACKWFVEKLTEGKMVYLRDTESMIEFVTKLNAANAAIEKGEKR